MPTTPCRPTQKPKNLLRYPLEIALELGRLEETVQVDAAMPLVESGKSTLSSVVDRRIIAEMPLNARQYLDLALMIPGVLPAAAGTVGGGMSINGARSQSNVFLLDGVSNMSTQLGAAIGNFRITDAVQEFAVQTNGAPAEFGRGTGGQVNIVTRSGTNQFHGSAFEYFRNSKLDAADFFTNRNRAVKNPLHRNQFGTTLGGPIRKDKLFFFASWEAFREVAPVVRTTRVPTATERAAVRDPISRALLRFWPDPNTVVPGSASNFIANVRSSRFDNTGLIRFDYELSQKDRINARWTQYEGTLVAPGAIPGTGGSRNLTIAINAGITHTRAFTPAILNELRVGFVRNDGGTVQEDTGFDASSIFTGPDGRPLPGVVRASENPRNSGLPTISVGGGFASLGSASNLPQQSVNNTYEIYDNVSDLAPFGFSGHSWRFGYHLRREESRRFRDFFARGAFAFANFAGFASGLASSSTLRSGSTLSYWRRYASDFYWQNSHTAGRGLTLHYGVRYEFPSANHQTRRQATNFIPGIGPVLLGTNQVLNIDPAKRGPAALYYTQAPFTLGDADIDLDKNNWAPVIGFAYAPRFAQPPSGSGRTVIRGGFRMSYDEIANITTSNIGLNPPYSLVTTQADGVTQPRPFSWATGFDQSVPLVANYGRQGPGTPTSGLVPIMGIDPGSRSPYIFQYSLGIQRQLAAGLSMEVDYQGSGGRKLGLFLDQNQPTVTVRDPSLPGNAAPNEQIFPYPLFFSVFTATNIANSNYNSVVFQTRYRGRGGISLLAWYALGKSLDYGSAFEGSIGERAGPATRTNLRLEHGPSSFDIRHRAVISYVMELPVGPGHRVAGWRNPWNRQVLGGWQISGITTLQSGTPFTVGNGALDFSGFNQGTDRPDVIGTGPLPQNNRDPDAAFSRAYFSTRPPHRPRRHFRAQPVLRPRLGELRLLGIEAVPADEGEPLSQVRR